MSQEPEAQTSSANAKADVPQGRRSRRRPRYPDRSRRHRCTDHREPGALLRRRPAHAVYLAGTRTGLRRSSGGRGLGQGDGGPHPQRRHRRAGAAAFRHRSGAIRNRAAARPVRLRVGAAVGQRSDGRRRGRARITADGPDELRDGGEGREPPGTAARGRPRRHLRAPSRDCPVHARGSAQQGLTRRGRSAQGRGSGRRQRRRQRAVAQRPHGGREGRARPGKHQGASHRHEAPSPTCARTSATSRRPARRS